jgi:malate dehydrogenase (oxaloacetate-decarboxylating)(NADP+)
VFVADTAVTTCPTSEELADIAEEAAGMARSLGYEPRVAMLAYSTFGHPPGERSERFGRGQDPRQAPGRFRV